MTFRLRAEWGHAEAKLSQVKPEDERARVLLALNRGGAHQNAPLPAKCGASRFDQAQALPPQTGCSSITSRVLGAGSA